MTQYKIKHGTPLFDIEMPGPGPYYTCLVDMRQVADFPGRYALYFSTDHDPGEGGIWLYICDGAPSDPRSWRSYDEAAAAGGFDHVPDRPAANPIFRDTVQGAGHTETPHAHVIDGTVYMTYHKNGIEGTQRTLLATSADGVRFDRIGGRADSVVLRYPPGERPGDGHTGYFRWAPNPFPGIAQRYVGYSLHGGGDQYHSALWASDDAVDWQVLDVLRPREGHAMPEEDKILIWHDIDPASIKPLGDGTFTALCGGGNRASGAAARIVELYEVYLAADGRTLTRPCRKVLGIRAGAPDAEELSSPTSLVVDGVCHLVYVGTAADGGANTVLGTVAPASPPATQPAALPPSERRRHIVGAPAPPDAEPLAAAMLFLRDLAADVVEASRVRPGQSVAGQGPNTTGGTLIRPGGRQCYPALWIRDFAMSLECGLVQADEAEHALRLTARCQAKEDWHTPSGSLVPRGAIADHITFDGQPIYFPGGLVYAEQGQPFGYYPCLDDHFYFVEIAWHLAVTCRRGALLLQEEIEGITLLERLALAFAVPTLGPESQLVWCDEARRGVSFGFTDIVVHTGSLLFCSLLRYRAAGRLADLYRLCGATEKEGVYRRLAAAVADEIRRTFADESGLLRASTGKSAQPDAWGSAFAVYCGALPPEDEKGVVAALVQALEAGTLAWQGNIRHVPTDRDFGDASMWQETVNDQAKNTYQNGAYWNTPTGWVCYALAQRDEAAARRLAVEYVDQLRVGDFRRGEAYGAPFECIHPAGDHRQNPVYLTSVTCPLAAFERLGWMAPEA